jgi:hypothetical protein
MILFCFILILQKRPYMNFLVTLNFKLSVGKVHTSYQKCDKLYFILSLANSC